MVVLAIVAVAILGIFIVLQGQSGTQNQTKTGARIMPTVTKNSTATFTTPTTDIATEKSIALTITSPTNGSTVTASSVTVKGKTVVGAEVFINDKETTADSQGNFSTILSLDEGDNPIVVLVNDENGNVAEQELSVTYEVSQ